MMHIAYLINQYPQTSQTFIRREIAALEDRGFSISRFSVRSWDQTLVDEGDEAERRRTKVVLSVGKIGLLRAMLATLFTRPGAWFRALKQAVRLGRRSDRGVLIHFIYLAEACVLRGWLSDCGAAHVHTHFGTNSTTVALLCRTLGGPPYSFTVHGPEEFDMPLSLSLGEKIRGATFVIGVSSYGRSQLYRWAAPADWPKVHVVHCGVDAGFLSAPDAAFPTAPRLVCVARLAEQKGQLLLIQAAALLRDEGIDFELILVGDGPMRREIEHLIDQLDLGRQVRITGWMSNADVRREILEARAMILPSFAEGLPVVIMEALALGRPVISTYVAGIPELVHEGVCGWLVPAGSIEDLAEAMRDALTAEPSRLEAMGRAGASRVTERHDAKIEAGKLADLITASAGVRGGTVAAPRSSAPVLQG
jgi:glycosyltransferase involved in cell wall biosynthesis